MGQLDTVDIPISKSNNGRMGRPPKHRIATLIRLDKTALARIDRALVKKEKRVDLIRIAVDRELARREKKHYKGPRS